jgi:hypothetical protein
MIFANENIRPDALNRVRVPPYLVIRSNDALPPKFAKGVLRLLDRGLRHLELTTECSSDEEGWKLILDGLGGSRLRELSLDTRFGAMPELPASLETLTVRCENVHFAGVVGKVANMKVRTLAIDCRELFGEINWTDEMIEALARSSVECFKCQLVQADCDRFVRGMMVSPTIQYLRFWHRRPIIWGLSPNYASERLNGPRSREKICSALLRRRCASGFINIGTDLVRMLVEMIFFSHK